MLEIEIEAGKEDEKSSPKVEVLDKAFEVLKKAGFAEDVLKEAYDILKKSCENTEEKKEAPSMDIKNNKSENVSTTSSDPKSALLEGMKAFMEKLAK